MASQPRLSIFDGLRGHLLIGMVLVHLSVDPDIDWLLYLSHSKLLFLRDAEFFVFISGLLVGYLWYQKYTSQATKKAFLLNRLSTIYRYYLLSAFPVFVLSLLAGNTFSMTVINILTMQSGGAYSDVLPIYFICFLILCPFVLIEALSRPSILFAASFGIYAASQLTALQGFFGFSGAFVAFDIAAWQFLFITSLLVGRHALEIPSYVRGLDAKVIVALLAVIMLTFGYLRITPYFPDPMDPGHQLVGITARFGLHPLYLLRIALIVAFVSIILIRKDAWLRPLHRLGHWYFNLSALRNVGKYSIQMFVFHVYILAIYQVVFSWADLLTKTLAALALVVLFIAVPSVVVGRQRRAAMNGAHEASRQNRRVA